MKINKEELKEIFKGIYNGEELKFNELYTKYYGLVYSIAFSVLKNKENAEDISQTIFTKIYSLPKNQLPTKSEASWLYSITKNEALNFIRKHKNSINIDDVYFIDEVNQIEKIISKDSYNRIMSKLDDKEREIVSLKVVSNLSFREISKLLNIPIGTVQWRYYKSLNTLKLWITNLSIFIVAISLFMAERSKKPNIDNKEESILQNEYLGNDTQRVNVMPSETLISEDKKSEIEKENIVINEEKEEVIEQIEKIDTPKTNFAEIGYLTISSIFFIFTIVFSIIIIKHQQKAKRRRTK